MNPSPFEALTYGDFDKPFDSIEGMAQYILNMENTAPLYSTLRHVISCQSTSNAEPAWTATTIGTICGMREARYLIEMGDSPITKTLIARRILNRAVTILRDGS